ncbi:unnamed protein product [Lymnaea stagnalis]|uniref:Laccase n=1 Tax=Lymnaea stagnalis TaxID=6523 RepID=A0AAV2H673_LYMST
MYLLFKIMLALGCHAHIVTAACLMTEDTCEFWLEVEHHLTMMSSKTAVFPANGTLYNVTNQMATISIDNVISADGWETSRLVAVFNKSMPGPPIEVYEGQKVIVHVRNLLTSGAVTVHWHGLHQKGSPWMDGVAFITQCPIAPGQQFTYKFEAYPRGTFWYHSHIGTQLSMGLLGAFIIRERIPPPMEEFIMMLQDWNHDMEADLLHYRMVYGNYVNRTKVQATMSPEGAHFSMFPFQSGLVNGKGRYYYPDGTNNQAPLTVFKVNATNSYRFRVIGAGNLYPFRVSIDEHNITLVASDGYDLQPVIVESFIINPGERYDFVVTANQEVGNYWIRAVTLEVNVKNHMAEAILRYDGANIDEPKTSRRNCTENNRCLVVNCPFSYYPEGTFTDCMNIGQLRTNISHDTPGGDMKKSEDIEDVFLNFAFPGTTWTPGAVNGRTFQFPPVSALTQPQDITTACDPNACGEEKICRCSYSVNLEFNKVYQFVFLNMGVGKGWAHPIHMHGHSFHVVKMGYPTYNKTTGKLRLYLADNLDVDCRGNPNREKSFCNAAGWANSSWGGNTVPGLELVLPPVKDTIMVPTGGYVVVRIRADNPGVWLMHCHIELHSMDGMILMLNESFGRHPAPPTDFPKCGDFHYKDKEQVRNQITYDSEEGEKDQIENRTFWIVVGCLIALAVIQFLVILCLCRKISKTKKATYDPTVSFKNDGYTSN